MGVLTTSPRFRAAVAAFDPTTVAGLYAGYMAGDSYTGSDGDLVATATDISGNSHDGTSSGSLRPTYKTSIWGSYPAFRFAGAQQLDAGTWSSQAQANTIVFAGRHTGSGGRICDYAGSGDRHLLQATSGNSNVEIHAGSTLAGGTYQTASPEILVGVFDGASSKIYQGGGSAAGSGNANTQAAGSWRVGNGDGGLFYNGDIAGILFYDSALSLDDINYLGEGFSDLIGASWTTAT